MSENESLKELLEDWSDDFRADPRLASKVRESVLQSRFRSGSGASGFVRWMEDAFSRPGLAACFAGIFILVGMGISQLISQLGHDAGKELTLSYRLSIDPLYRLQAMAGANEFSTQAFQPVSHTATEPPVLSAGLGWLQGQLDLSQAQYDSVTELHGEYERAFDEIFVQLMESHRSYRVFDRERMDNDVIDYFKLYELLQSQKRLSEESTRLTEELLGKVEQVIEPSQRVRYRELLERVYPRVSAGGKSKTNA